MNSQDNENSWSFYKHNLFNYCEKKYYLHYFGSQNGWNSTSSSKEQKLYLLKQQQPYKQWIKNLIINNIQKTFLSSHSTTFEKFTKSFEQSVFRDYLSDKYKIATDLWKNDPKSPFIKEIATCKDSKASILSQSEDYLTLINSIIKEYKLFTKFFSIPFQAKKNTLIPLYFYQDNIKIWNAPHIAWQLNNQIFNLNIYISSSKQQITNGSWDIIAAINSIHWQNNLKLPINKIETENIFINTSDKEILTVYGRRHPKEVVNIIQDSHFFIKSRQTYTQKIYEENYHKTKNKEKCKNCNFAEYCRN